MKNFRYIILSHIFFLFRCLCFGQTATTPEMQAKKIINELKRIDAYPLGAKDTLIDLNGDQLKDILIEYYGLAGSGEKNRIKAYLFDRSSKKFIASAQLENIVNPSFYLDKKIVVGYYVANGGGSATKFRWKGSVLDTLEHIQIDIKWENHSPVFSSKCNNYITKTTTTIVDGIINLPAVYNYNHYEPVIKR